jgi:hypothetical protein
MSSPVKPTHPYVSLNDLHVSSLRVFNEINKYGVYVIGNTYYMSYMIRLETEGNLYYSKPAGAGSIRKKLNMWTKLTAAELRFVVQEAHTRPADDERDLPARTRLSGGPLFRPHTARGSTIEQYFHTFNTMQAGIRVRKTGAMNQLPD